MNLYIRLIWVFLRYFFSDKKPAVILDKQVLKTRVWLNDIDLNGHMNNGRYLTIMDLGRLELVIKLGLLKRIIKEKMTPIVAGASIVYFKSLLPLKAFTLHTHVIYWDADWFYLRQDFINNNGELCASALVKVAFLNQAKRMDSYAFLSTKTHEASPKMPDYLKAFLKGEKQWLEFIKTQQHIV